MKIYSTKTGEVQHKIKKHTDWVTAVAFSPDGEMLATADRNGGIAFGIRTTPRNLHPRRPQVRRDRAELAWRFKIAGLIQ